MDLLAFFPIQLQLVISIGDGGIFRKIFLTCFMLCSFLMSPTEAGNQLHYK